MIQKLIFTLLLSFLLPLMGTSKPIQLKTEHLVNPLGIDEVAPRFTWQMKHTGQSENYSACQIEVATKPYNTAAELVWSSGILQINHFNVVYKGPALTPHTRYYWRVKLEGNKTGWSEWSDIAWFETGLMHTTGWHGKWITDTHNFHVKPAPYFAKDVTLQKEMASARIYIAAAGLYELSINGIRVGDHRLDPMYTRFDRRNLYVTYDVTNILQQGSNVMGVLLGNGWFNHQSTAVWNFDQAPWRGRPKFCLDLHITYKDGSKEIVSSDQTWKSAYSPVIFNSIYTAEHYDARQEIPGWDQPGFDHSSWRNAIPTGAPSQNITAQTLHPIRNVRKYKAANFTRVNDTLWVFDFGQNMSGVTRITASGSSGTVIRLKHGERLYDNGLVDISNIDVHYRPVDDSDPFQTDIFILSGKASESFMPKFNYKGFQYVEVSSSQPLELTSESMVAYFQHSDVPAAGRIHSSNPTLNKIWEAANASYLSNLFGFPTDCPQREKNGWTGDAHIAIETGLYNFDGITVYEKWLADHQDEQQPNGILPAIIPTGGWGYHWANGPDWTSTIAIIPWNIYLFYGDIRLLERTYDNLKRYVDYIDSQSPDFITDWGLGDWVPVKSVTPREFTSSAYYFVVATILSKSARLLGKEEDASKYEQLAENIRNAINDKYLNRATGKYGTGLQTELSVALFWGLVPEELRQKVADNLALRVIADNKHIDVGLLGTKTILNALSENGYPQLAYEVAAQESYPSWGHWIVNGATTFLENWPLDATRDISMNHIMFGEISAWYYKALGGIFPDETQPGFKHIVLRPHFVEGLDHFEASYESPYGKILSGWRRTNGLVEYEVTIPPGSSANLTLIGTQIKDQTEYFAGSRNAVFMSKSDTRQTIRLQAGTYRFLVN